MELFKILGISESILKAISDKGFENPTYIQEKTIPPILEGKDVIGQSSTGSGKTLAFGCGIIQKLNPGNGIGAIVLTPTRELAEQVSDALKVFSEYKRLRVTPIYGGVSIGPQIDKLRKADVVVATPGRLLDHLERRTIDLSRIQILVLDEADRMVDMGFIDDVNKIIKQCPKKRQTMLFSATMSADIEKIKHQYMYQPITITGRAQVDPSKLRQEYYDVRNQMKFSLLVHLMAEPHPGLALIFCNTRKQVDFITKNLKLNKFDAIAIHGGFTQAKRNANMEQFQLKNTSILVCTDVAARGLDIEGVSHIYNYDLPANSKEYIHRIGRTARAGKKGKVVNLISERDHENFGRIQREYPEIKIQNLATPDLKRAFMKKEPERERRQSGGFRQGRSPQKQRFNRRPRRN